MAFFLTPRLSAPIAVYTTFVGQSTSGLPKNFGPSIHLLSQMNSPTLTPLDASPAGLSLELTYRHWNVLKASLIVVTLVLILYVLQHRCAISPKD